MKRLSLVMLLLPALAGAEPKTLTLDDALALAAKNQPSLRQAHASTDVFRARADEAFAPNLPQVNATATYQRATANFSARPGALPAGINRQSGISLDTFDYFTAGVTGSIIAWDFQQTLGRWHAAQALAEAQGDTEAAQAVQVALAVRTAYFAARAQRELVAVAEATLANQQAHLNQVQGFVQVGTRPEIDLAQSKADLANARLQRITAAGNLASARARLNQAMGVEGSSDYEIVDPAMAAVSGEDGALDALVDRAWSARPEARAYDAQLRAQALTERAIRGGYLPSLGASVGLNLAGPAPAHLVPNANGLLTLNWNLYSGGLTHAQEQEAQSQQVVLEAQRDALHLQVRLDVEQAQVAVRTAQEAVAASTEALSAQDERLALAEGRYQAGVGSIIELGDAQVAHTQAAAQRVQSQFQLATARAQLLAALGSR
jgi:outer membrane protein